MSSETPFILLPAFLHGLLRTNNQVGAFVGLVIAIVYGAYLGIVETVQRVLIQDYVVQNLGETAYGVYYLLVGSVFFLSNAVVGTLWENFDSSVAVIYSIILSVMAILAMLLFSHNKAANQL